MTSGKPSYYKSGIEPPIWCSMQNPYSTKPDYHFWRRSFAGKTATEIDPVTSVKFAIGPNDKVATAGSCFAQHVSRTLASSGFNYMITETAPAFPFSKDENYGVFSARYGNIYTVRQLLQLLKRVYAFFEPLDTAWQRQDGRFVDPFRPYIQTDGFASPEEVEAERESHFAAVRTLFETSDVFIFTLGLTEGWQAVADGAVFPIAPGVVGAAGDEAAYRFHNFSVTEMEQDLRDFIRRLHQINPGCRVLLTVSPVSLIATYEDRHVLVATTYSKSVLRVVAEIIVREFAFVDYFPSYEMITGPHARSAFFEEDLREVRPEGVAYAMSKFAEHYMTNNTEAHPGHKTTVLDPEAVARQRTAIQEIAAVICDEEKIDTHL